MKNKIEKITIGESDYSREQMLSGKMGWSIGNTAGEFLQTISEYEKEGYEVKFETSILRKIFCVGVYKVVAIKPIM